MKVILTAFKGKLKSDVMDWPERTQPVVDMIMDMERQRLTVMETEATTAPVRSYKVGKFEYRGKSYTEDGQPVSEYVLIDVR